MDVEKCPICKTGTLIDGIPGPWCSRRYAAKAPCAFEAPLVHSPEEWQAWVAQWRKGGSR